MVTRPVPAALLLSAAIIASVAAPALAAPIAPAGAAPGPEAALGSGQVRVTLKASGLSSPVGVVNAGDGTNRLFVIEQRGTVRVFNGTSLVPGFFLDIQSQVLDGGEQGLLGLAFHPSFESNRKLFVYYTNGAGNLVIAEMTANGAGTSAGSLDTLLTIPHPNFGNHNGGQLLFGPDSYLYAFTGDGGGGGDPDENAQDINTLLGKTLRVAPNLSGSYSSPSGNPYDGGTPGRDEIWSIGHRNPWRASFDRDNGTLWIGDVGQGSWEEINREPAGTAGRNYGWDRCEGNHVFEGPGPCASGGLTGPVAEYSSADGSGQCSVTGGYVYRGSVFEDFAGHYVLGDYCSGFLWTLPSGAGSPTLRFHRDTNLAISSFGESESGELYLTDHGGRLYRVVAPPFNDVANSAHIDAITWLFYQGVTSGCGGGAYCPTDLVTREEMASFLDRALNPANTGSDFFTDDESSPHEGAINRLAAAGITGGCTATRFCPTAHVTRQQMASFIVRGWDLPTTGTDFFVDDEGSVHENDINRLAAAGITGGCTATRFCPMGDTTREEMAAFLKRAMT